MKYLFALLLTLLFLSAGAQTEFVVKDGVFYNIVSGDTLTKGMPIYVNSTNRKAYRADRAGAPSKKEAQGICSKNALPNDTLQIIWSGTILNYNTALERGEVYYLGATKGTITKNRPSFPDSESYQKIGDAVDTFIFKIGIQPTVIIPYTPTLASVTSVGATSYNDIIISDGSFTNLVLSGTDTAAIRFKDPIGEGFGTLSGPLKGTMSDNLEWKLPNKSGVIALLEDVGGSGSTPTLADVTSTGAETETPIILKNPGHIEVLRLPEVGGGIAFGDPNGTSNTFALRPPAISSGSWTYQLPDASGILALKSDIPTGTGGSSTQNLASVLTNGYYTGGNAIGFQSTYTQYLNSASPFPLTGDHNFFFPDTSGMLWVQSIPLDNKIFLRDYANGTLSTLSWEDHLQDNWSIQMPNASGEILAGEKASLTIDFPSVDENSTLDYNISWGGATIADMVLINPPATAMVSGISYSGWVSDTGQVSIRVTNASTVAADPGAGDFYIKLIKW